MEAIWKWKVGKGMRTYFNDGLRFTSIQALEAVVRLEGNDQLRTGEGNLSYEIANDYSVEEFKVDKGKYRTVITISLAPKIMLKGKGRNNG